jgi:integrase
MRKIDRQAVIAVLDSIAAAATPLQANRCQSVISAVFSWALDEGRIASHPALRIRRRGEERSRDLVMSGEEVQAFWQHLDGVFANAALAMKLLLVTGQRLGEVTGAATRELDLERDDPEWTIPAARTKNKLTHIVPLAPHAAKLFREALVLAKDSPFVFPARRLTPQALDGNQVSRQCKEVFRLIGAVEMRLHDLRHQTATGMAQCGVPLEIRQMVQNQVTGRRQSIGAIYDQHDYGFEKRRALELWEQSLAKTLAGDTSGRERY